MVLLGERLGGRHERRLGAVLDRAQHGGESDHGLAASHLPHQQPLHRPLAREVRVDLLDRLHLVAGELERQRPAPAVHHHAARRERPRLPPLAPRAPPPGHGELEQEQLLEGEPAASVALLLLGLRKVDGIEDRRAVGEALLHPQARRKRLGRGEHERPHAG